MRQSIQTHYIGPTDHRGSRVKAKTAGGLSLTQDWDDALDMDENHRRAAMALAVKLNWLGRWYAGGAVGGGYVFVQDDGGPDGFMICPPPRERTLAAVGGIAEADSRARAQAAVDAVFGYVPDPEGVR